jgi:transposase
LEITGKFKAYDTKQKIWRHMNFFQYQSNLHAKVPRMDLGNGKYRLVSTPWEGLANGFTLLFEAMLMELIRICQSVSAFLWENNASPEQIEQVSCDMSPAFIKASMRTCAMPRSTLSGSMTSSSSTTR